MAKPGAYVLCDKHGTEVVKGLPRQIRTSIPKGKNQQRFGGCPKCRSEKQKS